VGHRWAHSQGLTLIGDAVHVMKPFAGVRLNVAIEDALSLATQIKQWRRNGASSFLIGPIRGYEEEMFARAEGHTKETITTVVP
jgi:2-polyprenyl-6-methoxyphenol hydroxylase-like FAD-dependent oxidoreductase